MSGHDAVEVILTKRDRAALSDSQIDWVVAAYTRGEVADEQMSALAMAILLNGMERREIARWTAAMIASGERMDFSALSRPTADKHSTGGVGDKITLPLAPLVAACGVAVPQLSGRGLGHTGGTLDKLESIPGWRAALSNEEMLAQLESVGAVICAAGDGLAEVIMPCGRCRQLLFEQGGPDLLLLTPAGVRPMSEVLPDAFGPDDLTHVQEAR